MTPHEIRRVVALRLRAAAAVQRAKAGGRLAPSPACEACGRDYYVTGKGRPGVVWHHWSYRPSLWLDLIPLCGSCHKKVHWGVIPEPRTGRVYRLPFYRGQRKSHPRRRRAA